MEARKLWECVPLFVTIHPLFSVILILWITQYFTKGALYIYIIRCSKYWDAIIKVQILKSPEGLADPNFAFGMGQ